MAIPTLNGVSVVTKPDSVSSSWTVTNKLEDHKQEVYNVKWSPNGRYLATGHVDQSLIIWDASTMQSLVRQKCPKVPVGIQWKKAENALLAVSEVGRYCEWANPIPRTLPDPFKPFDAASIAARQYESQKNDLDKMFADEEPSAAPAQNEPKSTTPLPASLPPRSTAPVVAPSTSMPSLAPAPMAALGDAEQRPATKPISRSDLPPPQPRKSSSAGFTDLSDEEMDDRAYARGVADWTNGYGGHSAGGSGLFDLQEPFMPSATQNGGERRFLVWNHIGSIVSRVELRPTPQTSMEMDFSDLSLYKPFSLNQPFIVDLATMGEQGIFTSARQKSGRDSVTTLQFHMFNKFGMNADWTTRLPSGELALALAIGDKWSAVATSQRRLRLYGEAGGRLAVVALPGPVVALAGHGPLLAVVYHAGNPIGSNGLPRSYANGAKNKDEDLEADAGATGNTQNLGWWVFHVTSARLLSSGAPLPLCPGAALSWLGFSTEGALATFDSTGVLRQLGATQRFVSASSSQIIVDTTQALSALVPAWADVWLDVLDTSEHAMPGETFWPIAVTKDKMRYVSHSSILDGPHTQPRPVPSSLPLAMPFDAHNSPEAHENQLIRNSISLGAQIADSIESISSADGILGDTIDELTDETKPYLLDLASDKNLLATQAKLDGLVLKLVREAAEDGRVERALALAKRLVLKKSIQIAVQVAAKLDQSMLADRINEWSTRRENERKRRLAIQVRLTAPPTVVNSFNSLSSLPNSFESQWGDEPTTRNGKRGYGDVSAATSKTAVPPSRNAGSDDEFEVDDDEEDDDEAATAPPKKKVAAHAIDDDDDAALSVEDNDSEHENSSSRMQVDSGKRGIEGSVFKSSPFTIAPPFQQGSGRLADTLSSISKAASSSATTKGPSKSATSAQSPQKPKSTGFFRQTSK